jgi:hypothetical protein
MDELIVGSHMPENKAAVKTNGQERTARSSKGNSRWTRTKKAGPGLLGSAGNCYTNHVSKGAMVNAAHIRMSLYRLVTFMMKKMLDMAAGDRHFSWDNAPIQTGNSLQDCIAATHI